MVIDPGSDPAKIVEQCRPYQIRYLVCTHGHRNHAGAKEEVRELVGGETALSLLDAKQYLRSADRYLIDGDQLTFGDFAMEVIFTPGHSPGSLCFKVGNPAQHLVGVTPVVADAADPDHSQLPAIQAVHLSDGDVEGATHPGGERAHHLTLGLQRVTFGYVQSEHQAANHHQASV